MKQHTGNTIYQNLVKSWLIAILIFLPFQMKIATFVAQWSNKAATTINYLDELTIIIFSLLSLREYYIQRKVSISNRLFLFLLFPFFLFAICGWISQTLNGNSYFVTLLGTFDYIKHFLAIFLFAGV